MTDRPDPLHTIRAESDDERDKRWTAGHTDCLEKSADGYFCARPAGHSGRHAAYYSVSRGILGTWDNGGCRMGRQ